MAKLKFKGTTISDVEEELHRLCSASDVKEIPFNYVNKLVSVIGVQFIGFTGGSGTRFYHPYAVCGRNQFGYFGPDYIHNKKDKPFRYRDFIVYMLPVLKRIIEKLKLDRDN